MSSCKNCGHSKKLHEDGYCVWHRTASFAYIVIATCDCERFVE